MASFTLTSFSTTARTLNGNEVGVLINADAELVVSTGAAIEVTNSASPGTNYLIINGPVLATGTTSAAGGILQNGTNFEVSVGSTGKITSLTGDAIGSQVTGRFTLYNSGEISSHFDDTIDARTFGGGSPITIVNHGLIQGQDTAVSALSYGDETRIINTGTIVSYVGTAIFANWAGSGNGPSILNNSGTIIGATASFGHSSGDGVHLVRNSGLMDGDVNLGTNDDHYEGAGGQIIGTVSGGEDNDTLAGGDHADHFEGGNGMDVLVGRGGDDHLDGGTGGDLLLGGAGNDNMNGGDDNDTLTGNAGDDTMKGGSGNDALVGQDGSDNLDGGDDNDTLDGGGGDDILEGGDGNDILRGRAGEDDLAGGLGRDFLTGGQSADQFVFRSTSETVVGANRDQILDFEQGLDLIVIAGLSRAVFEFRGTAAFAPSGNPELRLFETPTGSTIVQLDATGNGTTDAEIRVAGVTGLTADDFVL